MAMNRIFASLILLLSLVSFACKESSGPTHMTPVPVSDLEIALATVQYTYTGYARDGSPIVRGFLYLHRQDSLTVTGRWQLRALADTNRIGPQHGHGTLVGHLRGNVLSINLNPDYVDNNVLLTGRFSRTGYSGQWQWVGFRGVITSGTFQAVRRLVVDENND
jgi:hypothetical protein